MTARPCLLFAHIDAANFLRDRLAVFWTAVYPILMLAVLMLVFGTAKPVESARYFVSGLAALNVISIILFGFTGQLIEMRASGALRMFYVLPMHKATFISGYVLSRVVITLCFTIIFIGAGYAAFGVTVQFDALFLAKLLGCLLIGTAMSVSFGLMLALIINRTTTGSAVINIINIPIMFLSDFFIPMQLMPNFIQESASFSPFYHFVFALRAVLDGHTVLAQVTPSILYMTAFAIGCVAVCGLIWRRAGKVR